MYIQVYFVVVFEIVKTKIIRKKISQFQPMKGLFKENVLGYPKTE